MTENVNAQQVAVRSIAWLDVWRGMLWNISNVFVDLDGSGTMQTVPAAALTTGNPILLLCGIIAIIGVRPATNDASKYVVSITQ